MPPVPYAPRAARTLPGCRSTVYTQAGPERMAAGRVGRGAVRWFARLKLVLKGSGQRADTSL
jgi:hypothetical protein